MRIESKAQTLDIVQFKRFETANKIYTGYVTSVLKVTDCLDTSLIGGYVYLVREIGKETSNLTRIDECEVVKVYRLVEKE